MEYEVTAADFKLPGYLETKKAATFEEAKKVRADFIAQGISLLSIQIVKVTREVIEDEEYTAAFNAFHAEVMAIVKEQRLAAQR